MPAEQQIPADQLIVSDATTGMCPPHPYPPTRPPAPSRPALRAIPAHEAPGTNTKAANECCGAAAADVGAVVTTAVTIAEQPVTANNVATGGGVAGAVPPQPAMTDATDRKRPLEADATAVAVPQQPAKRPKRRGKGRKNYAALENGDVGSSGEDEGGAAHGRVALKSLRDEDLPWGKLTQALSKDDKAAQMTLSADRLSVTSRKGYRTVRIMLYRIR